MAVFPLVKPSELLFTVFSQFTDESLREEK